VRQLKGRISIATDLRTLCTGLEHFNLPAALGQITEDLLTLWNGPFRERMGLTEEQLARVRLSSLLNLDESYAGVALENNHPKHLVRFVPCALKNPVTDETVPGKALRRQDGAVLFLLELPAGDAMFQEFIRGRLVGRTEERIRTRKFFHDLLSSKILVATFAAYAAKDKLSESGAEENKELARVTVILDEVIDAIANAFDEQTGETEAIPEEEAASVRRLAASILLSDGDKPAGLGSGRPIAT
jgi:hypothetical protein